MRQGPASVAQILQSKIEISAPPLPVTRYGASIIMESGWQPNDAQALEVAESWAPRILALLRRELDEMNRLGRFASYAFNSSSPELIQGSAFIEPRDLEDIKAAKSKRANFGSYLGALRSLTPRQFETLCVGVLSEFGVQQPVLTEYSRDEGVDFYGRLQLGSRLLPDSRFPGFQNQLNVWMVGQAKRYIDGKVLTPDVRDLVGAVTLAKAHAFGSSDSKYLDLKIRACDPIFFLFFTTGRLSSDAWRLLDRSGVVAMDGEMLAAFLADQSIGLVESTFVESALFDWLHDFDGTN